MNDWLADPDAPPNWLDQLDINIWPTVFVPISIRYETNRAEVFYGTLAARLAEIHGKTLNVDPASSYRDEVIEYLDLFHECERCCLVVIDGLDEAAG
ncbi:MAG: hypothetical protein KDG89_04235 [Geminicoccaceae bacterium]|nr:hypothetical protein [Geminicoccaceae bacterium]